MKLKYSRGVIIYGEFERGLGDYIDGDYGLIVFKRIYDSKMREWGGERFGVFLEC